MTKNGIVILRNEVTKDLISLKTACFKILRLRFAPLRMTKRAFIYSQRTVYFKPSSVLVLFFLSFRTAR